jgi:hypothetical protein
MYRISIKRMAVVAVVFALGGGTALAQGTMAQRSSCRPDVFRLCSSYIPNVEKIVTCLHDNGPQLSEACHEVMFSDHAEADGSRSRLHSRESQ